MSVQFDGYISPLFRDQTAKRFPRTVCVLGSTGSIGGNALDVLARNAESFRVAALAGGKNVEKLAAQAEIFRPPYLGVLDGDARQRLIPLLPKQYFPEIVTGAAGYEFLAGLPECDIALSAQVGAAGLRGTLAAAKAGKIIALANKESLVLAGPLIRAICMESGAQILPVDSEHNAIFQCLSGHNRNDVARLILTASGGPFRGFSPHDIKRVRPEDALKHPKWKMGAKISVDSATLMNKGLEIIEACALFGFTASQVDVLVHPQSIVHSLVEFKDGSQLAQLGAPDMRAAIAYCLGWPRRLNTGLPRLNLVSAGPLTFEEPDTAVFPCLNLARRALNAGNGRPIALNAANEEAVAAFLERRIAFTEIPLCIEYVLDSMSQHAHKNAQSLLQLEEIEALDARARDIAREWTRKNSEKSPRAATMKNGIAR